MSPHSTAFPSHSQKEPVAPAAGLVATFLVTDEEYRILLTDADDIAVAESLLAGAEGPTIPNGLVVRGDDGGVNAGYGWHIDPEDVEFADMTMEVCDGRPSDVEAEAISGDRYCPWSAELISLDPLVAE